MAKHAKLINNLLNIWQKRRDSARRDLDLRASQEHLGGVARARGGGWAPGAFHPLPRQPGRGQGDVGTRRPDNSKIRLTHNYEMAFIIEIHQRLCLPRSAARDTFCKSSAQLCRDSWYQVPSKHKARSAQGSAVKTPSLSASLSNHIGSMKASFKLNMAGGAASSVPFVASILYFDFLAILNPSWHHSGSLRVGRPPFRTLFESHAGLSFGVWGSIFFEVHLPKYYASLFRL